MAFTTENKNFWKVIGLFAGGIICCILCLIRMEQPRLDNRIRFSDSFYATVQTLCTIGIVIGVIMIIAGYALAKQTNSEA